MTIDLSSSPIPIESSRPFPQRASQWELRSCTLTSQQIPHLMGIVNVTPDSFSDGGNYFDPQRAIDRGLQLAAEGASLLDIGGESTRPFADPVSTSEELRRVIPVIQGLAAQTNVPISVDTSKGKIAREAIAAGAEVINDVTGFAGDPDMLPCAVELGVGICAMHMQGTPQTMQIHPTYDEVVQEILSYLAARQQVFLAAGIPHEKICLDPGIGFGKTHQHNLTLIAHMAKFHALGAPLLVGHSRKGFLSKIIGDKTADRLPATIGVALTLAQFGVQIIRVHDVLPVRQALMAYAASGGIDGIPWHLPETEPPLPR